jgi:transcriptional regulator with XRE-family HTH domain
MSRPLKQELVGQQVRKLRRRAGISLRSLAAQSGFSPSFISQLENGLVSPSINSMGRIGEILGVGLAEFFAAASPADGAQIVRALNRPRAESLWSQAQIELLVGGPKHALEPLLITLAAGGRSGKHPTAPEREEFMFVLEGELLVIVGPDELLMKAGDALIVRPREVRRYENPGPASARILVVSAAPPVMNAPSPPPRASRRRAPGRRSATRRTNRRTGPAPRRG